MAITWRQEGLKRHRHRIDEAIQKLFVHEALPAIKQNRFYERHIDELVGRRVKLSARDLVALTLYGYHALKSRFEDRAE